jgi:membrane peptidoglycan carboxypeptidase
MMQNAVENGTGGEAALWTMPVAGKTGTSTDYKDRWFVGCTPYYVAAVWTGYDIPERVQTSSNPAAKAWKKVMGPIHEGLTWQSFTYPLLEGNTGIFGIEDSYFNNRDEYYEDYGGTDSGYGYGDSYTGGNDDYVSGEDIYSDSFTGYGYTMSW